LRGLLQDLTALRQQIADKTLAGPGPEGLEAYQERLVQLNTQKEQLEVDIAQQIPEMNLEQQLYAADQEAVAIALTEDAVLVEFMRFPVYDFKAGSPKGRPRWKPAHYLAFVLPAGKPGAVTMIDLGRADLIDNRIDAFLGSITGRGRHDQRHLDFEPEIPDESISTIAGVDVRAMIFDPLLPALGACTRLFLAPDGDLARLPFEVLPLDDGHCLIDTYQISYLGTGRDVLRFEAETAGLSNYALVAADPDFDLGKDAAPTPAQDTEVPGRQSRDLDRSSDQRTLHFRRLPGTRLEGERIAALLGVEPLLGAEVLENRLKEHRSPRILHIATHGFFLQDQKHDPNEEKNGLGLLSLEADSRIAHLSRLENPLLRSGLALAGANTWLKGASLPGEAEDALLNGEDVTGMDLLDTELVVLSACETGLGEVHVGEGVFGLRRAFVLAGAKTLVMSLWKVPDEQTQALMVDFYKRLLRGEPRAGALRSAQLTMKARYPDPRYWGAFICQGDPSPMSFH
jgi:CHAT domain-containing protein